MEVSIICVVGVIFVMFIFLIAKYLFKKDPIAFIIRVTSRRFTFSLICLFSKNQYMEDQQ